MMNTTVNTNAAVTAKKLTKKDYFAALRKIVADDSKCSQKDELLKFIDHEVEILNKKSEKKTSGIQKANEAISETILKVMGELNKPVTISELMEDSRLQTYEVEEKGEKKVVKMSGQKLSALMTNLKKAEKVLRTVEKKKAYFSLSK
ncbi:MAG: hypothetical protein [Caudoviricetes sp.]|nr:MAG: hypothetical protein [Caudoviricetes sp.]